MASWIKCSAKQVSELLAIWTRLPSKDGNAWKVLDGVVRSLVAKGRRRLDVHARLPAEDVAQRVHARLIRRVCAPGYDPATERAPAGLVAKIAHDAVVDQIRDFQGAVEWTEDCDDLPEAAGDGGLAAVEASSDVLDIMRLAGRDHGFTLDDYAVVFLGWIRRMPRATAARVLCPPDDDGAGHRFDQRMYSAMRKLRAAARSQESEARRPERPA